MAELLKVRKARKRAKVSIKTAKRLIRKHGGDIQPEHKQEMVDALAALEAAYASKDKDAIYAAMKVLDESVDRRVGHLRKSPTREYIESIGTAVLIALFLRAFFVEAFVIPSGSMIPTLAEGDFLFVNKLSYGVRVPFQGSMPWRWDIPERGDVVVFVYPCDESLDYIKRVVAIPGDTVYASADAEAVVVNGELVRGEAPRPFDEFPWFSNAGSPCGGMAGTPVWRKVGNGDDSYATLGCEGGEQRSPERPRATPTERPATSWPFHGSYQTCGPPGGQPSPSAAPMPWQVPEGYVFVMGDNRLSSQDSRFWGLVPIENIKGRALFIFMSWNGSAQWSRFWNKIRWSRLFSAVHGVGQ